MLPKSRQHQSMKKRNVPMKNITFKSIFWGLAALRFCPEMQAVTPPPDGCYPNFTTAEGCNALQNLTGGAGNTGRWLVCAVWDFHRQLQHRGWRRSPGPQQRRFEYGSGHRSPFTQHRGYRKQRPWNSRPCNNDNGSRQYGSGRVRAVYQYRRQLQ